MKNLMAKRENGTLEQVALFAAGGLIGAVVALLLAPQSGKETRQSLTDLGTMAKKEAKRFESDLSKKMNHLITDIWKDLTSCLDDGKAWTDEKRKEIDQVLKTGKQRIEKEVEKILHA